MAGNTAVAVITDATTPAQRVLVTELNRAASDVASSGMNAPAIIAIGSIVGLRDALAGQGIEVSSDALLSDRVAEDLDR